MVLHASPSPSIRTNITAHSAPFVGRQREQAEIARLLADPACRLLTVIGPGGVGKTRLARQSAAGQLEQFADGVFFVALQAVQTPAMLPAAVAEALPVQLAGQDDLHHLLSGYLHDKTTLLVLDAMEHLLDAAAWLAELLAAAPGVKLMVTSREALNLYEEWLYPLDGLPYPADQQVDNLEAYDAVRLFVDRARRLRPDFSLADEAEGVVRVCRQVEGLPLALDMAATWVRTMRCAAIADEIQNNLDFLATRARDAPHHHRSVRAVCQHSWQLLSAEEQQVFARLAGFRGGFRSEAAEQIALATPGLLAALVDKSLLRWEPNNRFYQHELLRQFAWERLDETPGRAEAVQQQYCRYFAGFAAASLDGLIGGAQLATLNRLQADLDNLRVAWQIAASRQDVEAIRQMASVMSNYHQFRGRYREGTETMEIGLAAVARAASSPLRDETLAILHLELAWLNIRFGLISKATYHAAQAHTLMEQNNITPPHGVGTDPLLAFSLLAAVRGDYAEALRWCLQSYARSTQQGNVANQQYACYGVASAALELDDVDTARRYAREGLALCEAHQEYWLRAYLLNQLGRVGERQGDLRAAQRYYRDSYEIRQRFDDPEGMAAALNHLGAVYLNQTDSAAATETYTQSLSLYRDLNDRGGLATTLAGLGQAAVLEQKLDAARRHFEQALTIAAEIGYVALLRTLLPWVFGLLARFGVPPAAQLAEAEAGDPAALAALTHQLRILPVKDQTDAEPSPASETASPMVEPLTEREQEVLRCIAQGMSNQQIADALFLSLGTVKWYTGQIYGKLGVTRRTEAVARARQLHLIEP